MKVFAESNISMPFMEKKNGDSNKLASQNSQKERWIEFGLQLAQESETLSTLAPYLKSDRRDLEPFTDNAAERELSTWSQTTNAPLAAFKY